MNNLNLSKDNIKKICKLYSLGNFKNFKSLSGGYVNSNYLIQTNKGRFVARFLGRKYNSNKKKKLKLEFNVLETLKKNNFSYDTPQPIKNIKGKYISKIQNKPFWVYPYILGETNSQDLSIKNIKELSNLMALYHNSVKEIKRGPVTKFNIQKSIKELNKFSKETPKNQLEEYIHKNLELIQKCFNYITSLNFNENLLPCHSDFNKTNIVYTKDNVTGLIDFDNISFEPRIKDISRIINFRFFKEDKLENKKLFLFLEEYEKINPLTKNEKEMILPLSIFYACQDFKLYFDFGNSPNNLKFIKEVVGILKGLARELNLK